LLFDHQGSLNHQYDVIVIGSGISGLTISLLLAKEGKKVALFEKDRDIAPLFRPYRRKGCECSPGAHTIGWVDRGEVVTSLLQYLSILDGVETQLNENGFGTVIIGQNQYHLPRGYDNVEKSLCAYFPDHVEAVRSYIRALKEVVEQIVFLNPKLAPGSENNSYFGGAGDYTLQDFLKQYHASQELIDLLGTLSYILMGSKAEEVPFAIHAFVVGGYFESPGCIPFDGIHRLVSNIKRELARFGVEFFTSSEIAEIMIGAGRTVTGVKTFEGAAYFASNIIASFNPKLLNELVKPNLFRPVYRQRLNEAENTFGLFVVMYKVEGDIDIEVENLFYYNKGQDIKSQDMECRDIVLGVNSNRSGADRILSVFLVDEEQSCSRDIGERNKRAALKLKLVEDVIRQKIPTLAGKLVLLDYLKPWSFERFTNTVNGSAYGIKHTINSFGFQPRVPIHGLYLVGQAIYPGFLGSMISSFSLAFELLEGRNFLAEDY
jgi:all-trans-retinol 13,14-reductase